MIIESEITNISYIYLYMFDIEIKKSNYFELHLFYIESFLISHFHICNNLNPLELII